MAVATGPPLRRLRLVSSAAGPSRGSRAVGRAATGHPAGCRMSHVSNLVGRLAELEQMQDFLAGLEDRGEAVVLLGDAGIGKSSILHEVAAVAMTRGMTVLRTTGVEAESGLPYAGLHRLLAPLMSAG